MISMASRPLPDIDIMSGERFGDSVDNVPIIVSVAPKCFRLMVDAGKYRKYGRTPLSMMSYISVMVRELMALPSKT